MKCPHWNHSGLPPTLRGTAPYSEYCWVSHFESDFWSDDIQKIQSGKEFVESFLGEPRVPRGYMMMRLIALDYER